SPSKIANALSVINGLLPLDGSNNPSWREKLMMALTMGDIDHAIETPRLTPPAMAAEDIPAATDNPARQMSYDLEKANWERSNKKCLMVIRGTIILTIRGAIPECETATEYLQKIKDQFTGSSCQNSIELDLAIELKGKMFNNLQQGQGSDKDSNQNAGENPQRKGGLSQLTRWRLISAEMPFEEDPAKKGKKH
ncbi:hypothetical protein U9M48_028979, partial [Paspalum notatum var. saurae]